MRNRRLTPSPRTAVRAAVASTLFLTALGAAAPAAASPQVELRDQGGALLSPGALVDYGTWLQSEEALPRVYTLKNVGNMDLTLSSVTVSGGNRFVLVAPPPPVVVPPGGTYLFSIRFRRNLPGVHTHTVTLVSDDPASPFAYQVTGRVVPPSAEVELRDAGGALLSPGDVVDYGSWTQSADPVPRVFALTNIGQVDLTLSSVTVSGGNRFVFVAPPPPVVIPPGGTYHFSIRFRRNLPGVHTHTVTLASDDPVSPFVYQVTGQVAAVFPEVELRDAGGALLSPGAVVDYGTWPQSTDPLPRVFTLTNVGDGDLTLSSVTVSGGNRFVFVAPPPPVVVVPGATYLFSVRFRRDQVGEHTQTVTLVSDDAASPFVYQVTGRVVPSGPQVEVRDEDGSIVDPGSTVDYGPQPLGAPVLHRIFELTNVGNQDLHVTSSALDHGTRFVHTGLVPPVTLVPGASHDFNIRFRRDGAGTHGDTFTLASDDPDDDPFVFHVAGSVLASAGIVVRTGHGIAIEQGDVVEMPSTAVHLPDSLAFVVHNLGTEPLAIDNAGDMVDGEGYFLIEPPFAPGEPNVIAPEDSRVFRIRLFAHEPGTYEGTVTIENSDVDDDPFVFHLSGEVGEPDFGVTIQPGSRSVLAGNTATYTVSVAPAFGFEGPVALALGGAPTGASATFVPATVVPPGTSTLKVTTTAATPSGSSDLTVTGSGSGLARQATAELTVTNHPAPRIDGLTPATMPVGVRRTLIVTGEHLAGAVVTIPDTLENGRPVPEIDGYTVSADGRRIEAEIDARGTGVRGVYALAVETAGGVAAARFRVVHPLPEVDVWTPSETLGEGLYLMSIIGANLQGATVSTSNPSVAVANLENTDDDALTGILAVEDGAPPGPFSLIVTGAGGGQVVLDMDMVELGGETRQTTDLTAGMAGREGVPPLPPVYLQAPRISDDFDLERAEAAAGANQPLIGLDCLFSAHQRIFASTRTYVLPINELGDVDLSLLQGLPAPFGQIAAMGGLAVSLFASIDIYTEFDFCHFDQFSFCIFGRVGFDIPGVAGAIVSFRYCFPFGFGDFEHQITTTGLLADSDLFSEGECTEVSDTTPPGHQGGIFEAEVELTGCCSETVDAYVRGVSFAGTPFQHQFEGTIPIAEVEPEAHSCIPYEASIAAWVDQTPLDAILPALAQQASPDLRIKLALLPTCGLVLAKWAAGIPEHVWAPFVRQPNINFANAWLLAHSANEPPPFILDPDAFAAEEDYRLFNHLVASLSTDGDMAKARVIRHQAIVGPTPDPCSGRTLGPLSQAEAHPLNGTNRVTGLGVFGFGEGRVGFFGQIVDLTLNDCFRAPLPPPIACVNLPFDVGETTPWIWSVVRLDSDGMLDPFLPEVQIFPSYTVYEERNRVGLDPQVNPPGPFIDLDAGNSTKNPNSIP